MPGAFRPDLLGPGSWRSLGERLATACADEPDPETYAFKSF